MTDRVLERAASVKAGQVALWLVAAIPFLVGIVLALVWVLLVVLYSGGVEGFQLVRRRVHGGAG